MKTLYTVTYTSPVKTSTREIVLNEYSVDNDKPLITAAKSIYGPLYELLYVRWAIQLRNSEDDTRVFCSFGRDGLLKDFIDLDMIGEFLKKYPDYFDAATVIGELL